MSDTLTGGTVERRPDPLTDPLPEARTDQTGQVAPGPSHREHDESPTTPFPEHPSARTSSPRVDPPPSAASVPITQRRESVTCPECGTVANVQLTRRESTDFCAKCDFPLFWTPATIQLGEGSTDGATLRRLPGTGGKQTVAATPCPHCHEGNAINATTCVRCGLPMVLPAMPAPQPVVHVPPPPPPPEPNRTPWWIFAVLGVTTVLFVALVLWFLLGR